MSGGAEVQEVLSVLPVEHIGAVSEVASATGSTFNEVLTQAIGYALEHAREAFGVCLGGEVACDDCPDPCCGRGVTLCNVHTAQGGAA